MFNDSPAVVRRQRPPKPTIEINPYSVHLLGAPGSPIFDLIIDRGESESVVVVHLPVDLCAQLRHTLNTKRIGENLV